MFMFVKFVSFLRFTICCVLLYQATKTVIFWSNFILFFLKEIPKLHKLQASQNLDSPLHFTYLTSQWQMNSFPQSYCTPKSVKWKVSGTFLMTPLVFSFSRSYLWPGHWYFWKAPHIVQIYSPSWKLPSWYARDVKFEGTYFTKSGSSLIMGCEINLVGAHIVLMGWNRLACITRLVVFVKLLFCFKPK